LDLSIELPERELPVSSIQYEVKSSSYELSRIEWMAVTTGEVIVILQMAKVVKL
jgi:hypothetical protein